MTPFKRTLLLWILLLLIFAAFNLAYWPIWQYQQNRDPARFQVFAAHLHDQGETDRAIEVLRQGIREFQPPRPDPYNQLRVYLDERGREEEAAALYPQALFYHGTTLDTPDQRLLKWSQAVELALDLQPLPALDNPTAEAVGRFSGQLAGLYGLAEAVAQWPAIEQATLLRIAGGQIRADGQIGNTGARVRSAILVQSGGGTDSRRVAHIYVGGRDYAGAGRGWHVALIEAATGRVNQWGAFDLWSTEAEAERMLRFLTDTPDGTIAAFAVLDEGSVNMTAPLEAMLRNYGLYGAARVNRELRLLGLRYSFAALGVKGAGQGAAMQSWSPDAFQGMPGHPVVCGVLAAGGSPQ
jgi:hypothetical protein